MLFCCRFIGRDTQKPKEAQSVTTNIPQNTNCIALILLLILQRTILNGRSVIVVRRYTRKTINTIQVGHYSI